MAQVFASAIDANRREVDCLYIIKNIVLIGAAMVVGATVRGGRLVPEPAEAVGVHTGHAGRAAVDRPTESAL